MIIFGVSALVALITLFVIGFQLFSFLFDDGSGESFDERSRQALGLLTATVLVASYRFGIGRNDRVSDVAAIVAALGGVEAALVLVVAGVKGKVAVIPLEG